MFFFRKSLFFIFYYSGIISLFYFINRKKQRVIVYHHILPDALVDSSLLYSYSHKISSFKKQLSVLSKLFNNETNFGVPNSFILTFDDGAINNYTNALPILTENKMKAYFFVLAKQFKFNELMWVDKWFLWISNVPFGNYSLLGNDISIVNNNSRLEAHLILWKWLRNNYELKDNMIEAMNNCYLFANFNSHINLNSERFNFLTSEHLTKMKQSGHLIGCHSFNHDILSSQTDEQFDDELKKMRIDNFYNTNAFAIPFGATDDITQHKIDKLINNGYNPVLMNQQNVIYNNCLSRINLPDTDNVYEIHFYLSGLALFLRG